MKSAETLQSAMNKYQDELALVNNKIAELDDIWLRAGAIMDNREFLVQCQKRYDQLLEQRKDWEFKIRFTKWVLES